MIVGDLADCVSSYGLYPGQSASDFALELEKQYQKIKNVNI